MKRFLSITAVLFAATPVFAASVVSFDSTPFDTKNCDTAPATATITLPGQSAITVTSVGYNLRTQTGSRYCGDFLVSNEADFAKALATKDPTAQAERSAVASGSSADGQGMLFLAAMAVPTFAPAPIISSKFFDALNENTQQSATALTAEGGNGPLNAFLKMATNGGSVGFIGGATINVIIDGRAGSTYGQVFYQGPNGSLQGPDSLPSGTDVTKFVQNMVAIWYGDTSPTSKIDPDHRTFELKLLGLN